MITWRSHSESSASCGPVVTPSSSLIVLGQLQPGDDVHGLQLLEEQLAGVRDAEGGHVAGRLAVVAPETHVSVCQRAATQACTQHRDFPLPEQSSPSGHVLMAQKVKGTSVDAYPE